VPACAEIYGTYVARKRERCAVTVAKFYAATTSHARYDTILLVSVALTTKGRICLGSQAVALATFGRVCSVGLAVPPSSAELCFTEAEQAALLSVAVPAPELSVITAEQLALMIAAAPAPELDVTDWDGFSFAHANELELVVVPAEEADVEFGHVEVAVITVTDADYSELVADSGTLADIDSTNADENEIKVTPPATCPNK